MYTIHVGFYLIMLISVMRNLFIDFFGIIWMGAMVSIVLIRTYVAFPCTRNMNYQNPQLGPSLYEKWIIKVLESNEH
jgi:hypothetical protein